MRQMLDSGNTTSERPEQDEEELLRVGGGGSVFSAAPSALHDYSGLCLEQEPGGFSWGDAGIDQEKGFEAGAMAGGSMGTNEGSCLISLQHVWQSCLHPPHPPKLLLADQKYEKYYLKADVDRDKRMMTKLDRYLRRADRLAEEESSKAFRGKKVGLDPAPIRKGIRSRTEILLDEKLEKYRMYPSKFQELMKATVPAEVVGIDPNSRESDSKNNIEMERLFPQPPEHPRNQKIPDLKTRDRVTLIKVSD